MQDRIHGNACRSTVICVDSYEQGVPTGRLYSPGSDQATVFHSLTHLLTHMEHHLNETNSPQSFTAMRFFAPTPEPRNNGPSPCGPKRGTLGTFIVKVLFRQHTSWQGSVNWVEKHCEQPFRSVLKLIL